MTFGSVLLTILWLVVIPVIAGGIFSFRSSGMVADGCKDNSNIVKQIGIFTWSWFLGQLLLWCIFQVVAVGAILVNKDFFVIVKINLIITIAICAISVIINIIRIIRKRIIYQNICMVEAASDEAKKDSIIIAAWIVFAVILVIQVVLQIVLAYMDADDAYYVSEAVAIESSGNMYKLVPYTGITTVMDYRHSLEPFPVWLAFISKVTGTKVVSMAHVLLPAIFLPLTYGVYAIVGNRVLAKNKEKLPIYLIITELLVMFSLYSTKVPEKFFITRIRQGKSTIASLVIPGIVLCLFIILDYAKSNIRTDIVVWIMLFMLNMAGCLCSTLGALLCVIPIAIVAVMMIFAYKRGWHIIPMIIGCLPCFVFAALYVLKR